MQQCLLKERVGTKETGKLIPALLHQHQVVKMYICFFKQSMFKKNLKRKRQSL
jgi:hypothetical protein